ncbi:MAG: TPR end-of-group domain-containing protein [Akkermansiaceae bacterium]
MRYQYLLAEYEVVNDLEVVEGYLQLEMAEDALIELRNMPSKEQNSERYKELLLATQMMLQLWNPAAATAQELCKMDSREKAYFIHAAFCLHEMGETLAALRQLLAGPKVLLGDPLYHYNLACYHSVLGNLTDAQTCLNKSIELDPELELRAPEDKDLKNLFAT